MLGTEALLQNMVSSSMKKMEKNISQICGTACVFLASLFLLSQCTTEAEELEGTLVGPSNLVSGGALLFKSTIDTQLTTSCGTASAETDSSSSSSTTSTSSSSTSGSSSDSSSQVTRYTINSYIQFLLGETLLMRFTYDEDLENFRMIPSSTAVQTCPTTDYVSCNGTTGVNPTCETTDNISCGGSNTFIFLSRLPATTFEANSGTIDWSNGFSLNDNGNQVEFLDLEFNMVSASGALFSGKVRCLSR